MPRKAKELTDRQVRAIVAQGKKGLFAVGRVSGLSIQVIPPCGASWILRLTINGKRREMGLGPYPEIGLSTARDRALKQKLNIADTGNDPILEREKQRAEAKKKQFTSYTFEKLAKEYIEKRSKELKTQQQVRKLTNLLTNYAFPYIGNMQIQDIDLNAIKSMLDPIWEKKTESANRLRIYVSHVFDMAIARNIYKELNPARWNGGLKTLLAQPQKLNKTSHLKALDVEDMPFFWSKLIQQDWMGAKVLQFGILTGARSGEIRGALWTEINLEEKIWSLPEYRMKAGKSHTVPLSDAAINLLNSLPKLNNYIFPNSKGTMLSDATVSKVPKRIGYDVTAHGFRSTFKDWARQYVKFDHAPYDDDLSEIALAHINSDSTRAAYARNELLDERRPLMEDWSKYCNSQSNNVLPINQNVAGMEPK